MITKQQSNKEVLELLRQERNRFSNRNEQRFHSLIQELIRRKIYPEKTIEGNPNTIEQMVEGYGVEWHHWKPPFVCPHCQADLRNHNIGPPFKREIGHYDRDSDRTIYFSCPDCKQIL